MDRQKLEELQEKINAVSARYDARFAGKPRATRSLEELDELIAELAGLIAEGQGLMNGDNTALRATLDTATENLELYKKEREAIHEVKTQGAEVVEGAKLATWANFVFDEYYRHYANQSRQTRDLGRLEEMIAELEGIRDDMEDLLGRKEIDSTRTDLGIVTQNLEMYEAELDNILQARVAGTRDERVSALATMANDQFKVYRSQFAGKGRTTRRPELLGRVIKNLEGVLNQMRELNSKGSTRSQTNTKNIGIVQENLKLYRSELNEIKASREDTTVEDLAGMLGGAANDVMAEYRSHFAGQSRATRDLELLSGLCDEMYEISIQMRDISDAAPTLDVNNKNISIVVDNLVLYQAEYRRVQEAKGQA